MSMCIIESIQNKKGCPLSFIAISLGTVRGAYFQQQLDLQWQQWQHEQQQ